jgi:small subunit ribosomal protein S21
MSPKKGLTTLLLKPSSQFFFNYQLLYFMSLEVKVRKGEPMERALRRLKKRLDREGIIRDVRAKRYFVKPAQAKRRKKKELDFNNMLRVRYSNM